MFGNAAAKYADNLPHWLLTALLLALAAWLAWVALGSRQRKVAAISAVL
jgi:hypothetical protein